PRARLAQRQQHHAQSARRRIGRLGALPRAAGGGPGQHLGAAAAQGGARDGPDQDAAGRRVALLGLRGAGKSSLGEKLAGALGVPFLELDREVEREAGAGLGEVFAMYGQEAYRRFERRALERVLRAHDNAVIAAGGSLVTDPDTYRLLLDNCRTVWLKAKPEEHMSRVIAQGDMRPFKGRSAALDEIRTLLADRDRLYAR